LAITTANTELAYARTWSRIARIGDNIDPALRPPAAAKSLYTRFVLGRSQSLRLIRAFTRLQDVTARVVPAILAIRRVRRSDLRGYEKTVIEAGRAAQRPDERAFTNLERGLPTQVAAADAAAAQLGLGRCNAAAATYLAQIIDAQDAAGLLGVSGAGDLPAALVLFGWPPGG
jgi:hypothetical protein